MNFQFLASPVSDSQKYCHLYFRFSIYHHKEMGPWFQVSFKRPEKPGIRGLLDKLALVTEAKSANSIWENNVFKRFYLQHNYIPLVVW